MTDGLRDLRSIERQRAQNPPTFNKWGALAGPCSHDGRLRGAHHGPRLGSPSSIAFLHTEKR